MVNSRAATIFFKRDIIDLPREEIKWNYIKYSIKAEKAEKEASGNNWKTVTNLVNINSNIGITI